jgi:uncharacterized protein (DUF2141 family)
MLRTLSKLLFLISVISLYTNCARRGNPTGGPMDTIPPVLIKAVPELETINFTEKKFKIYFDEYIKIKDIKKNLVISPPQKYEPIITPAGSASKFISIKILDTLDANTTYSFNFGNSIVDNNEENELGNFKYVFSTGTFIDSLNLTGEVLDPKIQEVTNNIDVMLYEYNKFFTDSIIFKEKPRYLSNTLDSTLYDITNLRAGKYLLIALNDANNNNIYDPKTDKIGFLKDTITIPTDTSYNLVIFKEIPEIKVLKPKELHSGHLMFGFMGDVDGLNIDLLTEKPEGFNSSVVFEKDKDTLNYWYTPFENDSLNFTVSLGDYSEDFTLKTRKPDIDSLRVSTYSGNVLHMLDTFSISTNTPIVSIDQSLIKVTDIDTVTVDFSTILDPSKTQLYVDFEKKFDNEYHIEILPNTITDLFGISNDSIDVKLKTKTPEDYGIINVDLYSNIDTSFIIELLNEQGELIRTAKTPQEDLITFELLEPGNYLVRFILDKNNNGIWDTGNFLKRIQPETILFFKDRVIELRANWDPVEEFYIDN